MKMVSHHVPIYTISREEFLDYLRCPKIVSLKAFMTKHLQKETSSQFESTMGNLRTEEMPPRKGENRNISTIEITLTRQ